MKKYFSRLLFVTITIALVHPAAWGQRRIAIIPFDAVGVETYEVDTAIRLLRRNLEKSGDVVTVATDKITAIAASSRCYETTCAIDVGRQTGAQLVVVGSLNRLGEKVIVEYSVVDVGSERVVVGDNATASRIEELDLVMERVATSILEARPVTETIEVDTVTTAEGVEKNRRRAISNSGVVFGYLYPVNGYDDDSRVFTFDLRSIYEMRQFAIGTTLGLRRGLLLGVDGLFLPSTKDVTPYAGIGLHFHFVSHDDTRDRDDELRSDGPEIALKAGLIAFRTFNFRVVVGVEYSATFNDYDDSGFAFQVGILRQGRKIFGIF